MGSKEVMGAGGLWGLRELLGLRGLRRMRGLLYIYCTRVRTPGEQALWGFRAKCKRVNKVNGLKTVKGGQDEREEKFE